MSIQSFVHGFLRYTFYSVIPPDEPAEKPSSKPMITAEEGNFSDKKRNNNQENRSQIQADSKLTRSILKFASLIVGVICITSFVFLIVLAILDKPTPELLKNAFMLTLGYFLSSLTSFVEKTVSRS